MTHDPFEVRADIRGAYIVVGEVLITACCKGDAEIRHNIDRLKRKLDEAEKVMRKAWVEQDAKPDF